MANIGFDDSPSDRLEGTQVHSVVGGLILKGNSNRASQSPKKSVLGLQKLAEEKRKRKLEEDGEETKKIKALSSYRDEDWDESEFTGEARISAGSKGFKSKSRHYRSGLAETPSHTGGVNEDIREKQLQRLERDRDSRKGGLYAQSRPKDREKDYRKDRRDKNDDRERRRYEKREQSSRSSREYYRDGRENYFKEPRSSRSDWEETPYRSSRSRDEGYTPRHKSKGNRIFFAVDLIAFFSRIIDKLVLSSKLVMSFQHS